MSASVGDTGARSGLLALAVASVLTAGGLGLAHPAGAASGGGEPAVSDTALEVARVHDYLSRLGAFGLAGGVLVAVDGKVRLARGYGLADRGDGEDGGAPRAWTAGTVSSVGSITKQFTAAAIMELVERGHIAVDDSLGRFFDDVPADKRGITLHHLLTHTSGLDEVGSGDFDFLSREELVARGLERELLWEPGTRYRYSNLGYSLLGAVVEVVTGEDYESWLRENLFRPAGMYETGYVLPDYEPARVATGYRGIDRWGTVIQRLRPERGPSWVLRANGGIHTTLLDMHRWVEALGVMEMHPDGAGSDAADEVESDAAGDAGRPFLLSESSRERMFTPHADEGGGRSYYGYGWVVDTTSRGTPVIWHNGGNGILHADLHLYPAEGVETFMMTSASDLRATALLREVDEVLFGGEVEMPPAVDAVSVDPADLEDLTGRYELEGGGTLEVTSAGNALLLHARGQEAVDALWRGEPAGSVGYDELARRAARFVRAFADGDFAAIRSLMGPDAPEEPYRAFRERILAELGPLRDFEVLGTVPAWFHGGSSEATWLRLHFDGTSTIRRVHWRGDGTLEGLGGQVYPAPVTLRCAMTGPTGCVGWHEGLDTGEPTVTFDPASSGERTLTVRTSEDRAFTAVREGS